MCGPWPPGAADLKIGSAAGNLVLVERHTDRLEGRFVPGWANFMTIRRPADEPSFEQRGPVHESGVARTTTVEPEPWRNPILWFIARFAQPAGVNHGVTVDPDTRRPVATFLTAPDGSWCEITPRRRIQPLRGHRVRTHSLVDPCRDR